MVVFVFLIHSPIYPEDLQTMAVLWEPKTAHILLQVPISIISESQIS